MWKAPSLLPKRAAVKVVSQNPSKGECMVFLCITMEMCRGVAASRFVGRQDLVAYKGLVLTLGSMITIPMVWSM